jgi:putative hydrolase of the HAD superfamily
MKRPTLLLFDLGGVLLESSAHANLKQLTNIDLDIADYRERWLRSPAVRRFESGSCPPQEFAAEFLAEWRIALSHEDFLAQFTGWAQGFYPGALDLLATLRANFRTACLSNSNELHWHKFDGFEGVFDIALSSHRLGVIKPDDDAFVRALEICQVPAAEVMFFDDSLSNIHSARRLGMRAFQVEGLTALEDRLRAEGLLAN